MTHKTDIIIIGGGIAGCIAAISLADFYQVTLIDKLAEPVERIGECLAPAAKRILKKMGLLEGLESASLPNEKNHHLKNIGTRSFWGREQVYVVDHLRNPDGFGWHLNRKAFESYLRNAALEKGVKCIWPAKLFSSRFEKNQWQITANSNDKTSIKKTYHISAKFVIDASGRQSHFARSQGIKRQHLDKLIACWATLPNHETNKMSTISANKNGWWYSAPLPNNRRIIAFQTDSDLIERSEIKDLNSFLKLADENVEMKNILEKNEEPIDFHGIVAANSTRLERFAGQQWAALGDATISFDPLSSQGMFNAMASALQLTELMIKNGIIEDLSTENINSFETTYTYQIDRIWEHYLKHKDLFYREEKRWKDAPFWKRRH